MLCVHNISCTVQADPNILQCLLSALPGILEVCNNLFGVIPAVFGGICAVSGVMYLKSLREKKANATFCFEAQLYAHVYELKFMLDQDEKLLTGLYSDTVRKEWQNASAASAENLKQFYACAENTFNFIKTASDQMPAYRNWVADYTNLIQFLVDVLHYDIRDMKNNFKFYGMCSMEKRTEYWKSICSLLDTLLNGIRDDQTKITKKIFSNKGKRTPNSKS